MRTIFILGGSSDIGRGLANRYLSQGHRVIISYNKGRKAIDAHPGLTATANFAHIVEVNLSDDESLSRLQERYHREGDWWKWDQFISCVGTLDPIEPFLTGDAFAWRKSVDINAIGQLDVLNSLWPFHKPNPGVAFMAGGGTNGPMTNYSAYCASKIFLIKMAELLADENTDLNIFVLGPGYVKTKIHEQTLAAGERAGANLKKTQDFLATEGTSIKQIYDCLEWCFSNPQVSRGRNLDVRDAWDSGAVVLGHEDDGKLRISRDRGRDCA